MLFMVRSIFKHINLPTAYSPSNGFDSYQLYPCVWKLWEFWNLLGLRRGLVSDWAPPNRKFYRMHLHFDKDNQKHGVIYWTWNRYVPNRKLYIFSDAPQLAKTLRNNWENSHGHLNTRNLVVSNDIVMSSSNKFILYRTLSAKMNIINFCTFKLILPQENKEANKKQLICSA